MNNPNERTDIDLQWHVSSPSATSTMTTTSPATATSLFSFPGINTHRFSLPDPNQANFHAAQQNITGVPTQPPSVQASYPPYMNYAYPPFNSIPTISSHAFPFDSFHGHYQPTSSRLHLLAPKPPSDADVKSTGASQGQPPAFLETVKEIRKQLFEMVGLSASDEPLTEGSVYSKWRKAIINTWKPHSMTHYMMVAKLSNRCFALVVKIAESRQTKVTQSDFLDLYTKTESEQHTLLLDLLEGRVTFEDLRKRRRVTKNVTCTSRSENDYKEMAEELERLRKRNASLQMNLEEVIEERETDRRKIKDLTEKVRNLEKEQDEAYNQYRADVGDLIWQKHRLSESLTSSIENYGEDDEPFDHLEEQPSPLRVIEKRAQKKRGIASQHTGLQFVGTKKNMKFTERHISSSSETSSEEDDAPLSSVQKKKDKHIIGPKTSSPSTSSNVFQQKAKRKIDPKTSSQNTSSKVIQQKGKQIIGPKTSSAKTSAKVIEEFNLNTSEDSEDSGDWGSISEHCSNEEIVTNTQRARMEIQEIKKVISQEKPKLKRKKAVPSKETKVVHSGTSEDDEDCDVLSVSGHCKGRIRKNKTQKTEEVITKVPEVKKKVSQSQPKATTTKKTKPTISRLQQNERDRNEETDDDFVDEWDYNIENIERDDWVAVAYSGCDNCYIGQVEKKTQDFLRVNFLSQKNEFFYWPQIPD